MVCFNEPVIGSLYISRRHMLEIINSDVLHSLRIIFMLASDISSTCNSSMFAKVAI